MPQVQFSDLSEGDQFRFEGLPDRMVKHGRYALRYTGNALTGRTRMSGDEVVVSVKRDEENCDEY